MYNIKIISTVQYYSRVLGFFQVTNNNSGNVSYHFYYKSTGLNSKRSGEWFPFAGVALNEGHISKVGFDPADFEIHYPFGWIIKAAGVIAHSPTFGWKFRVFHYVGDRHNFPKLSERGIHPALIAYIIKEGDLEVVDPEWIHDDSINEEGARAWFEWCKSVPTDLEA